MYLKHAFYINNNAKKGYFCMCEHYGMFIFGEIVRVTGSKRIIVKTVDREHTLPKNCDLFVFDKSQYSYNHLETTLSLRAFFPNFCLEAFAKCQEIGVKLDERFCVSEHFEVKRPSFLTYQLAKKEYQRLTKNGAVNLIIHNGLKILHPK